jgi:UDPglucose 6-dehydrogenase
MKVTIIGTGYVGLVTGVSLAALGHKVVCVEINKEKMEMVKNGQPPFYERGVKELLQKLIKQKLFSVTSDLEKSVINSNVTMIAVGTPTVNNKIDLTYIKKASEQVGRALKKTKKYNVVVIKSTVLPGTTENVVKPILEKFSGKKAGVFGLCMNPEFLREGTALEDATHPDRVVIGALDEKSGKTFAKVYEKSDCPKVFTNLTTAEMTKYAANSLLATLISYSNEIARISEHTEGVDVLDVWQGVHLDRRLSPIIDGERIKPGILSYIFSGCGYGGSCFPKDTKALASFSDDIGASAELIKRVIEINRTQPERTIWHLKKALGNNLKNKKIAVLGIAFKPDTDDTRETAAFPIIEKLLLEKAQVVVHDPEVFKTTVPPELKNLAVVFAKTIEEAVKGADGVIVVTAWSHYKQLTPQFFKKYMKNSIVVDARRIYSKETFLKAGVKYMGIGL